LPTYTIDGSHFGNQFNLVLSGYSNAHPLSSGGDTITISSTALGVGDNVMQGNAGDVLRFDVQPISGSTGSLAELTVHVDGSGGWKATDYVNATVHYTDGTTSGGLNSTTGPYHIQWGSDQSVTITFDPNKIVDYVDLNPYGSSASFKIDAVGGKYTQETFPQDYQLHFGITGTDADQDAASSSFAVAVNTAHSGVYTITGTSGADSLYGTSGNDTFTGSSGSDTFEWHLADKGTTGSPAVDTVTDFDAVHSIGSAGGDVLALNDLIPDAAWTGGAASLANYLHFEQSGSSVNVYINSGGSVTSAPGHYDQEITLNNVSVSTLGGSLGTSDTQIIQNLLNNGHLTHNG
jgi:Ca2+-binding RTX toxin-like protein